MCWVLGRARAPWGYSNDQSIETEVVLVVTYVTFHFLFGLFLLIMSFSLFISTSCLSSFCTHRSFPFLSFFFLLPPMCADRGSPRCSEIIRGGEEPNSKPSFFLSLFPSNTNYCCSANRGVKSKDPSCWHVSFFFDSITGINTSENCRIHPIYSWGNDAIWQMS